MKKKRKPPLNRQTKMLAHPGGGNTYLGTVPAEPERQEASIEAQEALKKLEPGEIRFLQYYQQTGTKAGAIRKLRRGKVSDGFAWKKGGVLFKKIVDKIGMEGIHEVLGVSIGNIDRVLLDAMNARFKRQFITRSGEIVETEEQPDHAIRVDAAKEASKLLGLTKEKDDGPIQVNLVLYADPREPRWPGSGGCHDDLDAVDITPEEDKH